IGGIIPDLDITILPFVDEIEKLQIHRGFSHSLLFAGSISFLLGLLLYKIYKKRNLKLIHWFILLFSSILAHLFVDCFTNYGTQLFAPFSNYKVAWNTIFIIDPFFTLPLVINIFFLIFIQKYKKKKILNIIFINLSLLYLSFSIVNKVIVDNVFEKSFQNQEIVYSRYTTNPTPMNIIFWRCVCEVPDGYLVGYYSLFDGNDYIPFKYIRKNKHLIYDIQNTEEIQTLIWFSRGYYFVEKEDEYISFVNLNYDAIRGFEGNFSEYPFKYKIEIDSNKLSVQQVNPKFSINWGMVKRFVKRIIARE
ncbi:MAG: metal-dependent hydrolase, partial [Ignavibacteriales bacterium]|nr:metal-dependent hydrolase [Ignavibacteriales bacterium]